MAKFTYLPTYNFPSKRVQESKVANILFLERRLGTNC